MKKMKRREFLKTAGVAAMGAGCGVAAGIVKLQAQEKASNAPKAKEFQPGDTASRSGIYDVFHDKIDGEHHAHQVEADKRRTAFMEHRGWRVVLFWANEVVANREGIWTAIQMALSDVRHPLS